MFWYYLKICHQIYLISSVFKCTIKEQMCPISNTSKYFNIFQYFESEVLIYLFIFYVFHRIWTIMMICKCFQLMHVIHIYFNCFHGTSAVLMYIENVTVSKCVFQHISTIYIHFNVFDSSTNVNNLNTLSTLLIPLNPF